jgi:hypothetical protein
MSRRELIARNVSRCRSAVPCLPEGVEIELPYAERQKAVRFFVLLQDMNALCYDYLKGLLSASNTYLTTRRHCVLFLYFSIKPNRVRVVLAGVALLPCLLLHRKIT